MFGAMFQMSIIVVLNCSLLGCAEIVAHPAQSPAGEPKQVSGSTPKQQAETPFACNATALNPTERARWQTLLKQLAKAQQEVQELPDGFAIRFPAQSPIIRDVAEWMTYERLCCPFFDFELKIDREGGPLWLKLTGREGVKEFIRLEFNIG
jgi:hypothetical protein